jgi:hypothetical protein
MIRAFQILDQFLNLFELRQSQSHRLHHKRLSDRVLRGRQAQPQEAIYDLLEWFPRLAGFFIQQAGNVIIESKSRSHIMMLLPKAS